MSIFLDQTNVDRIYTNEWCGCKSKQTNKTNSMVWVRERTIPTERPPAVAKVHLKIYFLPYTGTTYTVSSGNCPRFSCATSSSLLMLTSAEPVSKMASQQEEAFCALSFEVSRSVITVQHGFRARFKKDASYKNNVFFKTCTKLMLHCNHRVFRFRSRFSFHRPLYAHHYLSSGAGTIRQTVADMPSGLCLTPTKDTNWIWTVRWGAFPIVGFNGHFSKGSSWMTYSRVNYGRCCTFKCRKTWNIQGKIIGDRISK
jgi:hypothetical protein